MGGRVQTLILLDTRVPTAASTLMCFSEPSEVGHMQSGSPPLSIALLAAASQHTVLKYYGESFWRDEAFSILLARRGPLAMVPLTAKDFNPPLYYLLLYGWMALFGSSEHAVRAMSMLFAAGTLVVVWLFMTGPMEVPRRRAVAYLTLFAVNPLLSYYAFEARMYSMLAFLASLAFYSFYVRSRRGYLIAATLGLCTHYFMLLVVASLIGLVILTENDRRRLVIMAAMPLVLFAPWLGVAFAFHASHNPPFWIQRPSVGLIRGFFAFLYLGHDDTAFQFPFHGVLTLFSVFGLALVGVAARAGVVAWRHGHKPYLLLLLLTWALFAPTTVLLASFIKPMFIARYVIFAGVGLLLIFVFAMEQLGPILRYSALTVLLLSAFLYQSIETTYVTKGHYADTIRPLAGSAGPNDVMFVLSDLDYFPAAYYFGESRVFIYGQSYESIPAYRGKALIAPDRIVERIDDRHRTFILVNDHEYRVAARAPARTDSQNDAGAAPHRQ
jgi:hypothetical protein